MGRGDRRSKKGKIAKSSFGNSRPHKVKKLTPPKPKAKASKKKAAAKK